MRTKVFLFFILSALYGVAQNKVSNKDANLAFLKTFYAHYLEGIDEKKDCMSKELIQKIGRMTKMMDADPIISAQDVTTQMKETLSVSHIKNQWYKVVYYTSFDNKKEYTTIFVKTEASKILAIYPWQIDIDEMDTILSVPNKISDKNNLDFVQTFYQNYLNCYMNNDLNLQELLKNFQKKYGSADFQQKIKETQKEYALDGVDGFDPLIADFDFDKSFFTSLKFSKIDNHKVLVQYKSAFGKDVKLYVYTKKLNNSYLIDNITE